MMDCLRILFIENKENAEIVKNELKKQNYNICSSIINDLSSLKAILKYEKWDVIIYFHNNSIMDSFKVLHIVREFSACLPFVLIYEKIEVKKAVNLMKEGCSSLIKQDEITCLGEIIRKEIEEAELREYKETLLEKIKVSEQSLRNTIESIGDGIISADRNRRINYINKTAEIITGWDKRNAAQMDLDQVFKLKRNGTDEILKNIFKKIIKSGCSSGLENGTILISKNGTEFYISANFSPIEDEKADVQGVIIVFRDITRIVKRIKQFERKLIESKHKAQEENKAKSSFLASMSHEIRTPLNGIEGMIDLTMRTDLTKEQKENLTIAKECSGALLEIINNILDFSKIEAGKMEVKNENFCIESLIKKTIKSNSVHASNKGIYLKYVIDPSLKKVYFGDCRKIQQVLNNLISNSIKFTNMGGIFLKAERLNEDKEGALIKFSVSDTGIGIAQEDMNKLFKSFSQADGSYTRKYGGTGLGLTISKKLADMMKGRILAESIKGDGSTFSLVLNIKYENPEFLENKIKKKAFIQEDVQYLHKKILIAEDFESNKLVVKKMCEKLGCIVKIAENGKEVIKMLGKENFDLVLMDIQMPVMNGVEAVRIIRENDKKTGLKTPIAALTAYALKDDREKFLRMGMDEYLSKPLMIEDLFNCIKKLTSKQIKTRQLRGENYLNIIQPYCNSDKAYCIDKVHYEIELLKEAIEKTDFTSCEQIFHKIKEFSLGFNSVIMKNTSFRGELASRRKDINGIYDHFSKLKDEFSNIAGSK